MTDAPGDFDEINLSVKDILLFSDGKPYKFGEITEIRLVLNESGTIMPLLTHPEVLVIAGTDTVATIAIR
jgi:hypothetical protein